MLHEVRLLVSETPSIDPKGAGGDAAQAEIEVDSFRSNSSLVSDFLAVRWSLPSLKCSMVFILPEVKRGVKVAGVLFQVSPVALNRPRPHS